MELRKTCRNTQNEFKRILVISMKTRIDKQKITRIDCGDIL